MMPWVRGKERKPALKRRRRPIRVELLPAPQVGTGKVRSGRGGDVARGAGGAGRVEGADPLVDPVGAEGGNEPLLPTCTVAGVFFHVSSRQVIGDLNSRLAAPDAVHSYVQTSLFHEGAFA